MVRTGIENRWADSSILAKNAPSGHQLNDFPKTPIALHGTVGTGAWWQVGNITVQVNKYTHIFWKILIKEKIKKAKKWAYTGCPKKNATLIELQSILTRLKLNIFERFKNQKNRADIDFWPSYGTLK